MRANANHAGRAIVSLIGNLMGANGKEQKRRF